MPIVIAESVTKHFGDGGRIVNVLLGIDLTIERGEFVTIMGPSGSGKSTLLNILGGIEVPSGGHLLVDGIDLAQATDDQRTLIRRRQLGYVFQDFNLLPPLCVEDNVALPLVLDRVPRGEAHRRALAVLELVGMGHRRRHLPAMLSGGERQRAAIARALVIEPVLLLADEPTGNLDSSNGRVVIDLLRQLCDARGVSIVMVTHDHDLARRTDRIIRICDGKLEADGSVDAPAGVQHESGAC